MIKNNFILSESEKKRISTLHRLPNFKPSFLLNEQDEIEVTWDSDEQKKTTDSESAKTQLKDTQLKTSLARIDFSNKKSVENAYNTLMDYIDMNYIGNTFTDFYDTLMLANQVYPNNGYESMAKELKNAADIKTGNNKKTVGSSRYNTMLNPVDNEINLYTPKTLSSTFGGNIIYKFKKLADAARVNPLTGKVDDPSLDKSQKRDANTVQTNVIKYLNDVKGGFAPELDDAKCIDVFEFYIYRVINGDYPVDAEKLRTLKQTIAGCNTRITYEPGKKGIFGKIRSKTSGNVYRNLKKREKEQLNNLQYLNNEFAVNITDPNKN